VGKKTGQNGQALVEYILLVAIIISISGIIISAVSSGRDKFWKAMVCDVSAGCAGCKSTDSAKAFLPKSGKNCPQ
jgi:hypothetical protein